MVTPRYHPDIGGIESVVMNIAQGLVEKGEEVRIITTTKDKKKSHIEEEVNGIIVERYGAIAPYNSYWFSYGLGKRVAAISSEFDIIHAHGYHAFPSLHAFRNRGKTPFVFTGHYHRNSHSRFRNILLKIYKHIAKKMVKGAEVVVCVSESERNLIQEDFDTQRPPIINHNGVERMGLLGLKKIPRSIVVIGRLIGYKNVDLAIRIIAELPAARLRIIGDGPEKRKLVELSKSIGVSDRVDFLGNVDEESKGEILESSKVLLALSEHESFGLTLVEGCMSGTRVVCSEIESHKEIQQVLPEWITCLETSNRDGIIREVEQIFTSECPSPEKERNSEVFSWKGNISRLQTIYRNVIDSL